MLDVVLLALKAGFLILLYLFIWLVLRGAARDVVSWGRASEPLAAAPPGPTPSRAAPDLYAGQPSVPASEPGPVVAAGRPVSAAALAQSPREPSPAPSQPSLQSSPASQPQPSLQPSPASQSLPPEAPRPPAPAVLTHSTVGEAVATPVAGPVAEAAALGAVAGAAPVPESTPEERRARREARAKERTLAGERLDFSDVINPRLVVEESSVLEVGTRYPLDGWVMIGRSPTSDIVLADSFVSSTHARLVPRGQLYFVEDLGSTNGTFVDGREVKEAQLKPDNRLRIGETTFRYEE